MTAAGEACRAASGSCGTLYGYTSGGRCDACRTASWRYNKARRIGRERGTWRGYVDAGPIVDHVVALHESGHSIPRIAELSGVAFGTVNGLRYSSPRRVRSCTAARILAVPLQPTLAVLTWRRIEAMVALGYPMTWIGRQIGIRTVAKFSRDFVLPRTAARIVAVSARIGDTPGPSAKARRVARERGWQPPAYWTDDFTAPADEEPVLVDEIAVERAVRGDHVALTAEERAAAAAALAEAGVGSGVIADRLHVSGSTALQLVAAGAA